MLIVGLVLDVVVRVAVHAVRKEERSYHVITQYDVSLRNTWDVGGVLRKDHGEATSHTVSATLSVSTGGTGGLTGVRCQEARAGLMSLGQREIVE